MLYLSISNGYGENEAKFKQFVNLAIGIQQFLALSLKLFYNFESFHDKILEKELP